MDELKREIIRLAGSAGFDAVGVSVPEISDSDRFLRWLESGYFGEMGYMSRNVDKRLEPRRIMDGVRSVICFGVSYYRGSGNGGQREEGEINEVDESDKFDELEEFEGFEESGEASGENGSKGDRWKEKEYSRRRVGRIARYAWGLDYHFVLKRKLHSLAKEIKGILGREFRYRAFVDSAPVLETSLACQAGLGWIGKNGCLLNRKMGSLFFLCELFVDFELSADEPITNRCGKCRKCIDACPTGAIVEPGIVDANKCISYLTIEYKGEIGKEESKAIGDWLFGCDVCQEVCPFNRNPISCRVDEFYEDVLGPVMDVDEVLSWDERAYKERTRRSAGARASLEQWKRNASIVAANIE